MTTDYLKKLVLEIVGEARRLVAARATEGKAPVNYACVFAQSQTEFDELTAAAGQLGLVIQQTAMGPVFRIAPLATVAGPLELLKIRRPDLKRKERGDADFTAADYENFKKTYLGQPGFSLIERPEMEMIELADPEFDVLAYFSHPTLAEILRVKLKK